MKKLYLALRLRRDLDGAALIHVDTEGERDLVSRQGFKAPIIVVPYGVRTSEFAHLPPRGTFRERYPQLGDRSLIVFLGRIYPGKGLEYLVPAMAHVATPGAGAMLVAVGPDAQGFRGRLEQMARECGVQERVLFTGLLTGMDRVAALVDADLFALPSDHENFGVSVIEALAAGTPVIVSDQVQLYPEIIRAAVGGVAQREPRQLAAEITRWLTDHTLRRSAALKARPFALETYDWAKIARRWVDAYGRLVGVKH